MVGGIETVSLENTPKEMHSLLKNYHQKTVHTINDRRNSIKLTLFLWIIYVFPKTTTINFSLDNFPSENIPIKLLIFDLSIFIRNKRNNPIFFMNFYL
jgi:hypothetical protein